MDGHRPPLRGGVAGTASGGRAGGSRVRTRARALGAEGGGEGAEAAGGAGGVRLRTAGCPEGLENADERTHGLVSCT